MNKRLLPLLGAALLPALTQCNTLEKDIAGINARNAEIAREPRGNYFVGRRYHVPATRFWGYLRQPGQTWRTAQLVIMDESACRTPDRLPEYTGNPRYAYDNNYEYRVYGKYTGKYGYEPNSNLRLPIFKPTRFEVANTTPGWLFKPSEKYDTGAVTLRPAIMPATTSLPSTILFHTASCWFPALAVFVCRRRENKPQHIFYQQGRACAIKRKAFPHFRPPRTLTCRKQSGRNQ